MRENKTHIYNCKQKMENGGAQQCRQAKNIKEKQEEKTENRKRRN